MQLSMSALFQKRDITPSFPITLSVRPIRRWCSKLMPLWKMFLRDQFHFGICFCLFECQNPEIEKMRPATAIGALKAAAEEQFSQH